MNVLYDSVNDQVNREKSLAVYWISSKYRKIFRGFCFICIESAAIANSICRDSSKICENHETFLSRSFWKQNIYSTENWLTLVGCITILVLVDKLISMGINLSVHALPCVPILAVCNVAKDVIATLH